MLGEGDGINIVTDKFPGEGEKGKQNRRKHKRVLGIFLLFSVSTPMAAEIKFSQNLLLWSQFKLI